MNLDDIVFENRNKEYGAYSIRKHYSERVNRAAVLSIGFAVLLFTIPTLFKSQKIIPEIVKRDPGTIFTAPPPIKLEQVQRTMAATVQKTVRNLPPAVTTAPEVTAPVENVDVPVSSGEESFVAGEITAIGNADVGALTEEPAIAAPPKVWDHTEIMPSYKGGMEAMIKFLSSKIRYPGPARRMGIEGTVFVSFVIGPDGNIMNAAVVRGISKECDAEALRVISMMPEWNPGIQGGTPVMVRMVLPITFKLAK